jgi:pilus assembly protein Flp/PilA
MQNLVTRFAKDESGATAIEYGLIAALVSVVIIVALRFLGSELSETFDAVATEMEGARGGE